MKRGLFIGLIALVALSEGTLVHQHRTTNLALRGGSSGMAAKKIVVDIVSDTV